MIHALGEMLGLTGPRDYRRLPRMVLINGLAEQPESWFCNRAEWGRHFDLKVPEFLVYDGPILHRRIADGLPITVEYLTDQLELYLEQFVQKPPYHLVASSLGCQVAVEYAVRRPEMIGHLVLLCPSGFGGEERLPIVEGVRHNDFQSIIASVFHDSRFVHPEIVRHYERQFVGRGWRKGLLRTVRGTSRHCVREKLGLIRQPVMVVCGQQDRIVDSEVARDAVRGLANYRFVMIPNCGHAPQIECSRRVNRLVLDFLSEQREAVQATVGGVPRTLVPSESYA